MRKWFGLCCVIVCLAPWAALAEQLSQEARGWLEQNSLWRVGVVLQTPYAQFQPGRGPLHGLNVDYTETMAAHLGVRLKWRDFASQEELELALAQGLIDVAVGVEQTPNGLQLWDFSDPYWRIAHVLVSEMRNEPRVDLWQLGRDQPIALRRSDALAGYLQANYRNLEIQRYPSAREALRAVLAQRARYAVIDQARLSALSQETEFAGLIPVADLGMPQLLRFASSKAQPYLGQALNAGLRRVSSAELEQLQARWLSVRTPHWSESVQLWRNVAIISALILLVVLLLTLELRRQRSDAERRLLEARRMLALREEAEETLHLAQVSLDHSPVGIVWLNWDSRVRYVNQALAQMLGYSAEQMHDQMLERFDPSVALDRWMSLWRRGRQQEDGPKRFESQCQCADGRVLAVEMTLGFVRFKQTEYLVLYIVDITERRHARAALEESEARLKAIAGNVPGLVFRLERISPEIGPEFAFVSDGCEQLVGYSPLQVMDPAFGIRSMVHPEDLPNYLSAQQDALNNGSNWRWQGRILTREGDVRWADIKASVRHLGEQCVVWDGVVWDVTENKLIELELANSRAQLRELSAHLESVREEEKARIAREVHDELGQVLTVLKMEISMCELAFAGLDEGLQQRLNSMKKLMVQLFQLVRDVATALRPPILDAGIVSAVDWQLKRFEARTGIACIAHLPEALPVLPDAKAVGLFRVLQEALTNVLRHAQAHSVEVELSHAHGQLNMSISDDGKGFEQSNLPAQSFGLVGMRERVLMLGGQLHISSRLGEGTTLNVALALDEEGAV